MVIEPLQVSGSALRRSAVPVALFAAGALTSFWLWAELRAAQRDQLTLMVRSAAEGSAKVVSARLRAEQLALAELGSLWARFGRQSDEAWLGSAAALVDHLPEFERLLWLDLRRDAVWAAAPDAPAAPLGAAERTALAPLLAAAREATARVFLGPEAGAEQRYHVVVPAGADGVRTGVLIGTARLDVAVAPIVRPLLERYQMRAYWDGLEMVRVGESAADATPRSAYVEVPGGGRIEIRVRPGPRLRAAVLGPAPSYALVAGLFASALLAALLFAYRVLHDRSAELAAASRKVEAEARRAREAERDAFRLAAELEDRVTARTTQLAEAVEELEAFNYSVSHDLRSPLGAIVNFCAILADEHGAELGPEGQDLIGRIGRSADTAVAMMDGLLELSRLGRAPLSLQQIDMESLARETMEQARSAAGAGAVRFELGRLPPARGDPTLLRLVLWNLLRNALKYSQFREKPRIAVSGERAGQELVYSVRDDGVGFDMRYAAKLFRPFQRLHGAADFPGSGIGLAIVSRAVRRHGGRVWAEGEVGQGATFSFALPVDLPDGEALA